MSDSPDINLNLSGMGGAPTPDVGTPQAPQVQQAPQQAPDPQMIAQQAQIAHDSMFGRAAKAILGQQNNYSVAPDGTLQNNPVPQAPGQLFRTILGAALLGGAAGASGDPAQGFAGGVARGGAAGIQQAQQLDQQKRAQAEQDFKNQQAVQQQNREQTLMNAQVQQMHSEMVGRQHTSDLQDQEAHDKHNAASAALETNLTAAGGTPAVIPVNGKAASSFSAPDLAAAYVSDPSILKGPNGFIRHFIDTTDSSELEYNGHNWVDSAGNPVNMTDKTTVKAFDVPIDAMKTTIPTTGKDINAARGIDLVDPNQIYQMSPLGMDNLNTKRMAEAKQQAAIDADKHTAATADAELGLKRRELADKERSEASVDAAEQPDALGFTPNVAGMGGVKEYNKRINPYKKNFDDLARTEASYQQFGDTLHDLASGKDMTGAQSVVGLFNAIGLSATPLAGRGFRITENTIKEHQQARGWGQALQAKLLGAKDGDIITPRQLQDYASIAQQARYSQYVNLANELHASGLSANPALPTGNGQKIDPSTAKIFLTLSGGNPDKAAAAAKAKGWDF